MMIRVVLSAAVCLCLAGCGGGQQNATVEGSVTFDGNPVPSGQISFTPVEGGGTAVSTEINAGRYRATGAPTGRVRVLFLAMQPTGKTLTDPDTGEEYPETTPLLPDRYMTTGVEITLSDGEQTHDFPLES